MREQEPPYSIQIELTEGCNLRCPFCGLQGIREEGPNKNFKFMTQDTIQSIATQIHEAGWNARIEFAMHGEPTMHPEYHSMIGTFHNHAPKNQIMMTSNGGGLLRERRSSINIAMLFANGLSILALDEYDGINIVSKIRDKRDELIEMGFEVREYPADPEGNPHRRIGKRKLISLMVDPSISTAGTHSKLTNHAGAAFPKNEKQAGKRCHRPFREMSIRWDGNVAVCCNDWRGEFKCGNVVTDGLISTWNGEFFDAARRKLYLGQRDFGPCSGCDAVSYRVGLLPDKLGRETMEPVTAETNEIIDRALAGPSYTPAVKRPWE